MISQAFRQNILQALEKDLDYFEEGSRFAQLKEDYLKKGPTREASVAILLGGEKGLENPSVLMTQRTETLDSHKGQMAFPGGTLDPEDQEGSGDPLEKAALRELEEEVGVSPGQVEVLGKLPKAFTFSSRFWVTPYVVTLKNQTLSDVEIVLSAQEIARAYWISLEKLESEGVYRKEWMEALGVRFQTHVFQVGEDRIWGATAAMLRNFLDRLDAM